MDSEHHSLYFKNQIDGSTLTFRLANHSGNAYQFLRRGEITGNFGVVIKMENGKFKKNKRVDYTEEVFFPSELTPEKEDAIANGVSNWIATGEYNGPRGDRTKQSVRTEQTPAPQNQQVSQPATPPTGQGVQAPPPAPSATPPTGPEVQESLATKYFKEAHNMKYRLLKEAAVRTLMEDDDYYGLDYENAINFPSRLPRDTYPPVKIVYGGQEMTTEEAREIIRSEFQRMVDDGRFDGISGLSNEAWDWYGDFRIKLTRANEGDEFPAFAEYMEGKIQRYREWLTELNSPEGKKRREENYRRWKQSKIG